MNVAPLHREAPRNKTSFTGKGETRSCAAVHQSKHAF